MAVDSPPLPQVIDTAHHYVPFETNKFREAACWAAEQVVRKYPGSSDIMALHEALIKQHLAGQRSGV